MASFTAVGDSVTLDLTYKGDVAAVAIFGTYNMTIALQRESGSKGSGAWDTIKEWSTANATVAYNYTATRANESLRLYVKVDTSGTATATLTDAGDVLLEEVRDESGAIIQKRFEGGGVVNYDTYVLLTDANATITEANSGKTHIIANVSADRTFTLPSPKAGLNYTFIPQVAAADGHDWIFDTGSDTNFFIGGVVHLDVDSDAAGDEVVIVGSDLNSNSKFQVNLPNPGTEVKMFCDGTNWYISGFVTSATAPAFADQ